MARLARITIAPELRGKGIAHDMLVLVLTEASAHPQIERVELNVFSWNEAAIKTYTRLGFSYEETRRSSVKVGIDRWDTVMMGQLRTDWASRAAYGLMRWRPSVIDVLHSLEGRRALSRPGPANILKHSAITPPRTDAWAFTKDGQHGHRASAGPL